MSDEQIEWKTMYGPRGVHGDMYRVRPVGQWWAVARRSHGASRKAWTSFVSPRAAPFAFDVLKHDVVDAREHEAQEEAEVSALAKAIRYLERGE